MTSMPLRAWVSGLAFLCSIACVFFILAKCGGNVSLLKEVVAHPVAASIYFLWASTPSIIPFLGAVRFASPMASVIVTVAAVAIAASWVIVMLDTFTNCEACRNIGYIYVFGPAVLLAFSVLATLLALLVHLVSRSSSSLKS